MDGHPQIPSEPRDFAYCPRTERVMENLLSLHEAWKILVKVQIEIEVPVRSLRIRGILSLCPFLESYHSACRCDAGDAASRR